MTGYKDDEDKQGDLEYRERVDHIRFTLADICLKKYDDRFSFFRLLNRVIFLFQEPLCFAVCRSIGGSKGYQVDRNTIRDPLYESQFQVALKEHLGFNEKRMTIPEKRVEEYLIPLFDTSYGVIAFGIKRNPKAKFRPQQVSYVPIRNTEPIGKCLVDVFRPFGRTLRKLGVENHLKTDFDSLFDKTVYLKAIMDDPSKDGCAASPGDLDVIRRYVRKSDKWTEESSPRSDYLSIEELLEAEMDLILSSPLLCPPKALVSNLLITRKCFDRSEVRFDSYFYGIDTFLSQSQRQQFCEGLAQISSSCRDDFIPFDHAETRRWFWEVAAAGRFDELLSCLELPLSRQARLFPEYVLMSGAAILNVNPFSRSDIGWLRGSMSTKEREREMRRFAVLHYLLQMMAPGISQPSLLTLPLRVSGATWMAATFVVSGEPDSAEEAAIVPSEEFQRRFLIYHSLMRDFENRLRRKSKDAYIRAIYDIFIQYLDEKHQRDGAKPGKDGPIDLGLGDYRALNGRLTALNRLYPYDAIHFGKREGMEHFDTEIEDLGHACNTSIGILHQNPFFDRLPLRAFLDRGEVGRRLRDLVNAEVGQRQKQFRLVG